MEKKGSFGKKIVLFFNAYLLEREKGEKEREGRGETGKTKRVERIKNQHGVN